MSHAQTVPTNGVRGSRLVRALRCDPCSVLWLTVGDGRVASTRVRAVRISDELARGGARSRCLVGRGWRGHVAAVLALMRPQRPGVIVIQKLLYGRLMLTFLRLMSRCLLWECDDALHLGYPDSDEQARRRLLGRLPHTLACVDLVTTSNTLLANDLKPASGRVVTYPGPAPPRRDGEVVRERVLLWLGSSGTEPYLALLGDIPARLSRNGWTCVAVGASPSVASHGWVAVPWTPQTQEQWLRTSAVGIMPQPADEWADRKQGYKLLEYAANGVIPVASDVRPARALLEPAGLDSLLVRGDDGWIPVIEEAAHKREGILPAVSRLVERTSVRNATACWVRAVREVGGLCG